MKSIEKEKLNYNKRIHNLNQKITRIISENNLKNIVIFGAGDHTKQLLKFPELKKVNIDFIVDNNKQKWNTEFCNYKVYPPEKIDNKVENILISSKSFEKEIYEQLIKMGISKNKIFRLYIPN